MRRKDAPPECARVRYDGARLACVSTACDSLWTPWETARGAQSADNGGVEG